MHACFAIQIFAMSFLFLAISEHSIMSKHVVQQCTFCVYTFQCSASDNHLICVVVNICEDVSGG